MKRKTNNIVALAALIVALVILATLMCACNDKTNSLEKKIWELEQQIHGIEADTTQKSVVIYVGEKKFELTTRKSFLHEALVGLKEDGSISEYSFSGSALNAFILQIDDLQQSDGKYYSVWLNVQNSSLWSVYDENFYPSRGVAKDGDYGMRYLSTTFHETELYYASVGVSLIPLVDGCTYAILVD